MLDLLYISHLDRGKQKNLAYAFELAKKISSPLSLLPTSSLYNPGQGGILIWKPPKASETKDWIVPSLTEIKHGAKKKSIPLYLLGKPNQPCRSNRVALNIIRQVIGLGFPLLLLPYDYPFKGIRNVLFTGNAPGLTDHPLKHRIAATFLPRAFKLEHNGLQRIHWNNISLISETNNSAPHSSWERLNTLIQRYRIDLTIFPVADTQPSITSYASWELQGLLRCENPALLIPRSSETRDYREERDCITEMQLL